MSAHDHLKQPDACDDLAGAERILAAAQRLFAEKGFAAVSIQDIARAASVSKSNVFHHFRSKEDLYVAVLSCACDEAANRVQEQLAGDEPFPVRLKRMMTADIESMFEQPERTQLVLREIMNTRPDDPDQPAPAVLRENSAGLVSTVRDAQARGEIRADVDPSAVAFLFFAANKFYFQTRNLMRHFPDVDYADDHARYVEKVADLILNGVLPK